MDEVFQMMARDDFSKWTIHCRYLSLYGTIAASVPHELADGRLTVSRLVTPLVDLGSDHPAQIDTANIETVSTQPDRTRFQTYLRYQLTLGSLKEASSIAIAVDVSTLAIDGFGTKRNKVCFPIFTRAALLELCDLPAAEWKSQILNSARSEAEAYATWVARLSRFEPKRRWAIFEKLPLNGVDSVVSYFGAVDKLTTIESAKLLPLEFSVVHSRGPKKVHVCFSTGPIFKSCTTSPSHFEAPWSAPAEIIRIE